MQRALVIIFMLGAAVKLLDIGYTHLLRPYLVGQYHAPRKPRPPAPYADADRARDAARAAWLQREAEKNPTLARLARERREERMRPGARLPN
jgi:hypothetical protein